MGDTYVLSGDPLNGFSRNAKDIDFDPTGTDLQSTDSESAIKEVNSNLSDFESKFSLSQDCVAIVRLYAGSNLYLGVADNVNSVAYQLFISQSGIEFRQTGQPNKTLSWD